MVLLLETGNAQLTCIKSQVRKSLRGIKRNGRLTLGGLAGGICCRTLWAWSPSSSSSSFLSNLATPCCGPLSFWSLFAGFKPSGWTSDCFLPTKSASLSLSFPWNRGGTTWWSSSFKISFSMWPSTCKNSSYVDNWFSSAQGLNTLYLNFQKLTKCSVYCDHIHRLIFFCLLLPNSNTW